MGGITNQDIDSEFEEFVIDQITAIGCEAVPQIGVKDILLILVSDIQNGHMGS